MLFSVTDIYISSSVNSIGKCISWRKLLACGMSKSVVLIKQTDNSSRIINQFTEHKDIVTCVSWLNDNNLISCDNSGSLIVWKFDDNGDLLNTANYKVDKFVSGIADVNGVIIGNDTYIVCCCEERWSLIKVTECLEISEIISITYGLLYVHTVKAIVIKDYILISCGLSDGRLMCQSYDIKNNILSTSVSLSGHEDAVVSIDAIKIDNRVLIATASLDCYVRLWEASIWTPKCTKTEIDTHTITCESLRIDIRLAAVLAGHENWVTSVNFAGDELCVTLVSTSMDKSVIVWKENVGEDKSEYCEWNEETRLGQVGGNGLGFIGGSISPSGKMIASVGYQGAMIVWAYNQQTSLWNSVVNVGGHFDVVEDLAWENGLGRYLLTVSKDQTTRIHAPWRRKEVCEWHEVGRPQVHGFDMTCVASLDPVTFVSGADEKISRVFSMNKSVNDLLKKVSGDDFNEYSLSADTVTTDALGLSNKVVLDGCAGDRDDGDDDAVPKEERIVARTLWPEVTKLYGHVYEVFRVTGHSGRRVVATCCKAAVPEYADIIIWDSNSWTIVQRLSWHKSTVVRVRFTRDGRGLVSVSKDRQWALWRDSSDAGVHYDMVAHSSRPQCHAKVIWDCDWTADDSAFVTVSRDKKMILWDGQTGAMVGAPLSLGDSINAVSTWPQSREDAHIFAVGMESGLIHIVSFSLATLQWSVALTITAHHDWVTRLAFHPLIVDQCTCLLASCSKDRFVKVYEISLQ